jgi:quinolinate synthase
MAMNELQALDQVFERSDNEVFVDRLVAEQAMVPLRRMLDFAAGLHKSVIGSA